MKVGVIATIVGAAAAVLLFVWPGGSDTTTTQTTGNNCPGDRTTCTYTQTLEPIESKREAEVLADSRTWADTPPKGDGPWPFVVVRTLGKGLKVRTTNTAQGDHINGLAELDQAWAVCQENSGFDPDPGTGAGPVWLKIKWAHQTPGTDFRVSDLNAKETGWAYRGYLVPIGHNGDIPQC